MSNLQRYGPFESQSPSDDVDRSVPCIYTRRNNKPIVTGQNPSTAPKNFPTLQPLVDAGTSPGIRSVEKSPSGLSTNLGTSHEYEENLDNDMVAAINQQTSGTEFYGRSSNFVFLTRLLSQARSRLPASDRRFLSHDENSPPLHTHSEVTQTTKIPSNPIQPTGSNELSQAPLSVVNLLSDESATLPDPQSTSPMTVAGRARQDRLSQASTPKSRPLPRSNMENDRPNPFNSTTSEFSSDRTAQNVSDCFFGNPMFLEREYVDLYFRNLHFIYPFLLPDSFKSRCEEEIWRSSSLKRLCRKEMHFLALYNAVLAVGALTAPIDVLEGLRAELEMLSEDDRLHGPKNVPSSVRLSKLYFQRARNILGDFVEVCSLEGAQCLLLLSIYCQHALRPHVSYMYSGMAVRTALAIGLTTKSAKSNEMMSVAARTWWCIYSQEIKVSSFSGRTHSLMSPSEYRLAWHRHLNNSPVSIIPSQIELATILGTVAKELYASNPELRNDRRSQIALRLDEDLERWKSNLPQWLNYEVTCLREPEWASKQKLALQIRFYQTKMFIHRPFLSSLTRLPLESVHINICVSTACKSLHALYLAFTHRHYLRSWWYNATHTLTASIVILYVLLVDHPDSYADYTKQEMILAVEKALEVLRAMDHMPISSRYALLVEEILKVAMQYPNHVTESGSSEKDLSTSDIHPDGADRLMQEGVEESQHVDGEVSRSISQAFRVSDAPGSWQPLVNLIDSYSLDEYMIGDETFNFDSLGGWNVGGNLSHDSNLQGDAPFWNWSDR